MIVPAGAGGLPASQGLRPGPRDARRRHHHLRTAHDRDRAGGPPLRPWAAQPRHGRRRRLRGARRGRRRVLRRRHRPVRRRWARSAPIDVALLPIWGWGRTSARATSTPSGRPAPSSWCARSSWCRCTGAPTPPSACADPTWLDTPVHRFTDELTPRGAADRLRCSLRASDLLLPARRPPERPELSAMTGTDDVRPRPGGPADDRPRSSAAAIVVVITTALALWVLAAVLDGFDIDSPGDALLAGLVVGLRQRGGVAAAVVRRGADLGADPRHRGDRARRAPRAARARRAARRHASTASGRRS